MSQKQRWPDPERAEPPTASPVNSDHASSTSRQGRALHWLPCTCSFPQDITSQLHRRRSASARSIPLDCACRDPWPCRCTEPPLTERALDGWAAAARHLLAAGRMPLLPVEVLRSLYRRGGPDRALAEQLHELAGGRAA